MSIPKGYREKTLIDVKGGLEYSSPPLLFR